VARAADHPLHYWIRNVDRRMEGHVCRTYPPSSASYQFSFSNLPIQVLHGLHHQHVRPWELFIQEEDAKLESSNESISRKSLESTSNNSFEDEPWVAKYQKRNVVRQIFDREIWIQEPALRQIQDTIFIQALLTATAASAVLVAIFVAVPSGHVL
jgi:hypothetical protein